MNYWRFEAIMVFENYWRIKCNFFSRVSLQKRSDCAARVESPLLNPRYATRESISRYPALMVFEK
jgi:hypothetical protein